MNLYFYNFTYDITYLRYNFIIIIQQHSLVLIIITTILLFLFILLLTTSYYYCITNLFIVTNIVKNSFHLYNSPAETMTQIPIIFITLLKCW